MHSQNANRIYAPILIGITLLIGIFVSRPLYESYMNNEVEYARLVTIKLQKDKTLADLLVLQETFGTASSGSTEFSKKINKLGKRWDSSDIISAVMLNEYTLSNSFTVARASIGSISVSEGVKLPSGLSLGSVSFSVSTASLDNMIDFITYLTQTAPYIFTINEISLPIDTGEANGSSGVDNGLTLSLSLGVYYYE